MHTRKNKHTLAPSSTNYFWCAPLLHWRMLGLSHEVSSSFRTSLAALLAAAGHYVKRSCPQKISETEPNHFKTVLPLQGALSGAVNSLEVPIGFPAAEFAGTFPITAQLFPTRTHNTPHSFSRQRRTFNLHHHRQNRALAYPTKHAFARFLYQQHPNCAHSMSQPLRLLTHTSGSVPIPTKVLPMFPRHLQEPQM